MKKGSKPSCIDRLPKRDFLYADGLSVSLRGSGLGASAAITLLSIALSGRRQTKKSRPRTLMRARMPTTTAKTGHAAAKKIARRATIRSAVRDPMNTA